MFVHTVFFWLKDPKNEADRKRLHEGIQSLTTIDAIHQSWIGVPASTRRPVIDHSYDFSITFVFKNKEDQDIYQEHPVHLAFVKSCGSLWTRVQVYDAVSVSNSEG